MPDVRKYTYCHFLESDPKKEAITIKWSLPYCVRECHSNSAAGWEGTALSLNLNLWNHSLLHLECTTVSRTLWDLNLDLVTSYPSLVVGMAPAIPFPGYQWRSHLASVHQLFNNIICHYDGANEEMLKAMYIYINSILHELYSWRNKGDSIALKVNFSVTNLPKVFALNISSMLQSMIWSFSVTKSEMIWT